VVTPAAKREAVAHACAVHEVSERRACEALGVDRSSVRYRSRRACDAAARLRKRKFARLLRRVTEVGYGELRTVIRDVRDYLFLGHSVVALCRTISWTRSR
jgi:putative transposase